MPLVPGTRLGPYEITAAIGAGGMGEVYKARDSRLRRDVAVKVLPASAAADADRLHRFEQEACAAAALNHPNILTVHEIAVADGPPYVVSELLEGETLRAKLERGSVSVRIALEYAIPILNGLAAAHDKSIVHRDLKPENLFITADSRVKILDFGLAKLLQPAPTADLAGAPTRVADTTPGVVLGTIGYMSPEQVRGGAVDQRSDLFSVGTVLHEMLSGKRPFDGDSPADVMSAILHADPPELSVATGRRISPPLDRIVRRCLEKDPARRFQSARDLAFALEALSSDSASIAAAVPAPATRRRALLAAAMAVAAVAAVMIWLSGRLREAPSAFVQNVARVTHDLGFSEWPTWSPDGRMFAFTSNRGGNFDIYLARVDGGQEFVNVTRHASDNVQPAFSPDGASIAFVSTRSSRRQLTKISTFSGLGFARSYGGDIWVIPALGGQARRLAPDGNSPAWSPDGRTIAYVSGDESQRTIVIVPADGGPPHPLLPKESSKWEIVRLAYSPNGRWISFETAEGTVFVMPVAGGTPTELLRGRGHTWASSGRRLYFFAVHETGSRIEAADIRERNHRLTVTNVKGVGTNTGPLQDMAMASDGERLLVSDIEVSVNLTRVPLTADGDNLAGPEEILGTGHVRDRYPAVSPDGRRILFGSNRFGLQELWTIEMDSGQRQRVELPRVPYEGVTGCWLRDSRHIVAMTIMGDTNAFWRVALDGSATEQIVGPGHGGSAITVGGWACAASPPDGRTILYLRQVGEFTQLMLLDMLSKREQQLTSSLSQKYEATWSPDGRWVAFATTSSGGINIRRIPATGGEEQPLTDGVERIRHFFYSLDGRWLYIQLNHRNIYRMPANGGPRQQVTRFPETPSLFIEEPTISPDGRYLVYARDHGGSSIWMFTLKVP